MIKTVREKGLRALYRGVSVQITGTAAKAGVRFLAFEEYKRILSGHGASATASIAVSGLLAGITEAILVVTPSETIKTKMIHDQNRKGGPRYSGLVSGVRTIVREEGLAGIYRGLTAVILRQGANQTVRLTSYGIMREKLAHRFPVDPKTGKVVPPVWASFGMGMIAGIITVYTTMPLDVVKTKMQSLDAKKNYRNSLDCLLKTTKNDGVLSLWNGSTPRLGRLMVCFHSFILNTIIPTSSFSVLRGNRFLNLRASYERTGRIRHTINRFYSANRILSAPCSSISLTFLLHLNFGADLVQIEVKLKQKKISKCVSHEINL